MNTNSRFLLSPCLFLKERYPGKINSVEAKVEALTRFFDMGCGIGILKNAGSMRIKNQIEGFPLLGQR